MKHFLQVAAVLFGVAGAVYGYEALTGGPTRIAATEDAQQVKGRVAQVQTAKTKVTRSPPHRVKTDRTVDEINAPPRKPVHLERMIEARGGSQFPILIPASMTRDAATAEDYKVRLKLMDDGYSAVMTTAEMDIVIYGTRTVFRRKADVEAEFEEIKRDIATGANSRTSDTRNQPIDPRTGEIRPRVRPPYVKSFEVDHDGKGGVISMGRYGVDYHVEFYCHPKEEETENCIDESKARDFLVQMEESYDGE